MSKKYDIVNRLKALNDRPFICVAEGKAFSVDTGKTAGIHLMALNKDESLDEMTKIDKMIEIALGEKAAKEIDEMNLSMEALGLIVEAIGAAIGGEELSEVDKRFPDKEE